MKNIVLIGFMGTGKTSVGLRLAIRTGREFVDTDREIEVSVGCSVAEVFANHGEAWFRAKEDNLVAKLSRLRGRVIATGGGMVLNPDNVALLKKNGVLILLQASPAVIFERVKGKGTRPLLAGGDPEGNIKRLIVERGEAYRAAADYRVDTSSLNLVEVVEEIVTLLEGLPS